MSKLPEFDRRKSTPHRFFGVQVLSIHTQDHVQKDEQGQATGKEIPLPAGHDGWDHYILDRDDAIGPSHSLGDTVETCRLIAARRQAEEEAKAQAEAPTPQPETMTLSASATIPVEDKPVAEGHTASPASAGDASAAAPKDEPPPPQGGEQGLQEPEQPQAGATDATAGISSPERSA